jgi:hypothetical protein
VTLEGVEVAQRGRAEDRRTEGEGGGIEDGARIVLRMGRGPLGIRWYGVLFAAGLLGAYEVGWRIFQRDGMPRAEVDRLFIRLQQVLNESR